MTSFKRTQRKYVQKAYRVRNWREWVRGSRHPAREQKKGSGICRDMPGYAGI